MYAGCPILERRKARDPAFAVTTGTISPIGRPQRSHIVWNWSDCRFRNQVKRHLTSTKVTWDARPNGRDQSFRA